MHWSEYKIIKVDKDQKGYPKNLLCLKDAPKQIYFRGELETALSGRSIAIVGSRRMTRYGAWAVERFASAFAQNNITTISGYMYGADTEVHVKTIEYGGSTIAVMGNGLNQPYPPDNDKLYTKILQSRGAVLSEYEPDRKPKLWMYPQRNRIVAALATVGVLVIEAGEGSGSLITIEIARKLKKNIYAIPGPINSQVSVGTNKLIKEGIAKLVTCPEDILKINTKHKDSNIAPELNALEKNILEILKNEDMSIDELSIKTKRSVMEAGTALSLLSLKSLIRESGGRYSVV